MKVKAGDRILVEAEQVGQTIRRGIIEEVLTTDPPRLRVRWENGHTTVYAPTAGNAQIKPAGQRR
jgi:Domain of unknown function (DUF1918)